MKKIVSAFLLCSFLSLPAVFASAAETLPWNDAYYQRQGRYLLIGPDEAQTTCFYGLKIGDAKDDVVKKLAPAFTLMYELKAIGPQYLLSDRVYPDYYLSVQFDENNRVSVITYQKNTVYHID